MDEAVLRAQFLDEEEEACQEGGSELHGPESPSLRILVHRKLLKTGQAALCLQVGHSQQHP